MMTFIRKAKREIAYYQALMIHQRTPRISRWLLGAAIAYFLSPIDLIPDGIPILGQLDDLVIVTGLVYAALLLIPNPVKIECRNKTANKNR